MCADWVQWWLLRSLITCSPVSAEAAFIWGLCWAGIPYGFLKCMADDTDYRLQGDWCCGPELNSCLHVALQQYGGFLQGPPKSECSQIPRWKLQHFSWYVTKSHAESLLPQSVGQSVTGSAALLEHKSTGSTLNVNLIISNSITASKLVFI